MKLLFLGIDGISYRVIKRLRQKKIIPLFEEEGFKDNMLLSLISRGYTEPHTGPAWSSIYTGATPKEHGIESGGWLIKHKGISDLKVKTAWEILDENNVSCGLFCLPVTYPAPKLKNGWVISGFPRPSNDERSFYPSDLPRSVKDLEISILGGKQGGELRKIFDKKAILEIEENKVRAFLQLVKDRRVDVGAFVSMAIDQSSHLIPQQYSFLFSKFYYHLRKFSKLPALNKLTLIKWYTHLVEILDGDTPITEDLFAVYITTFKMIQNLIDTIEPENVLICSDHGFYKYGTEKYLPNHDVFGYIGTNGEISKYLKNRMDLRDIVPMILKVFKLECTKIGEKIKRESYKYSEDETEKIQEKLKALGYI